MISKFNKNLEKVQEIIKEIDNAKINEEEAKSKYSEGNKLLDDCIKLINENKFKLEEIKVK